MFRDLNKNGCVGLLNFLTVNVNDKIIMISSYHYIIISLNIFKNNLKNHQKVFFKKKGVTFIFKKLKLLYFFWKN